MQQWTIFTLIGLVGITYLTIVLGLWLSRTTGLNLAITMPISIIGAALLVLVLRKILAPKLK